MGNLKDISTARMIGITEAWLDPARDRNKLASLTSGKPLLDVIQAAHDGLVATHMPDGPRSREVSTIADKQARMDRTHDRKARAVYFLLSGFAEASDDPNQVAALLSARDELLPNGLSSMAESYQEEANNAEMAAKRVSAASKGLLKKLAIPTGTVWNLVEAWFAAARELGTLEHQKGRLNASPSEEALRARNVWIRVVHHVQSTLELEGVREDVAKAILQDVRAAEQESERRAVDPYQTHAPKA